MTVEKVHNRLLEEELPVTPAVLSLIDIAQTSFRVWVDTLRRKHRVTPDATALRAAIAKVEAEFPAAPAAAAERARGGRTGRRSRRDPVCRAGNGAGNRVSRDRGDRTRRDRDGANPRTRPRRNPSAAPAEIIEFAPRAALVRAARIARAVVAARLGRSQPRPRK